MNCLCFRRNLTVFAAMATLLLGASLHGIAADAASTISGRVVDVDGNPIAWYVNGCSDHRNGGRGRVANVHAIGKYADTKGLCRFAQIANR